MKRFALILALMWAGCAAPRQYFRPTERHHGQTVQGYAEAMYALIGPQGQFGEAKLWSRGSYWDREGQTVIHLAVEVHNTGAQPLTLPAAELRLESVETELGVLNDVPPRGARDREIPPGTIRETGVEFVLPARVAPGDVRSFVVRWNVRGATQAYGQRTPFVVENRSAYQDYPPYYTYRHGYAYPYYVCDGLDPFCPYRSGYYAYGPPYGPPHRAVITPPSPPGGGIVVHPRR
jgi:hypothetical protein